jgi:heme exporter protein C
VRLAESLLHPRVFATAEGGLPGSMLFTLLVSVAGIGLLWLTLVRFELAAKAASAHLARLRRALEPGEAPLPGRGGTGPSAAVSAARADAAGAGAAGRRATSGGTASSSPPGPAGPGAGGC